MNNRLTCGGPEVTNQTGNDDGERHKVQPVRPVVLLICLVTGKSGVHVGAGRTYRNRPKIPIRLLIPREAWGLHTEQETEKIGREQVEIIVHRACQPIEDWSRRVQDEHRSSVSYQKAALKQSLSPWDHEGTERSSPVAPFQVECLIFLCSRPAAWMVLISVPHIPSCPTTSYNGDWRTKNSSAAFANGTDVSERRLKRTNKPH